MEYKMIETRGIVREGRESVRPSFLKLRPQFALCYLGISRANSGKNETQIETEMEEETNQNVSI